MELELDAAETVVSGTELEAETVKLRLDCTGLGLEVVEAEAEAGPRLTNAGSVKLVMRSVG